MEENEQDKKKLTMIGIGVAVVLAALVFGAMLKDYRDKLYSDDQQSTLSAPVSTLGASSSQPAPPVAWPDSTTSSAPATAQPESTLTEAEDAHAAANAAIQAKIDSQPTMSSIRITPVSSLFDQVFGTFQNRDDLTGGTRDWTLIAISGVVDLRILPWDAPPPPDKTVTIGINGADKYCGFKLVSADAWPWNEAGQRMDRGEDVSSFPAEYNPTLYVDVMLNADSFSQAVTLHHGDRVVVVGQYQGASSGGIDVADGHIVPPGAISAGVVQFKGSTSVRDVTKSWAW